MLKVDERTIARDRAELRKANALVVGPNFPNEFLGNMLAQLEAGMNRLRKAVRGNQVAPEAKVQAESACMQVMLQFAELLRKTGYLPTAAMQVNANLQHQHHLLDSAQLRQEFAELQAALGDNGDPIIRKRLKDTHQVLRVLDVGEQIHDLDRDLRARAEEDRP